MKEPVTRRSPSTSPPGYSLEDTSPQEPPGWLGATFTKTLVSVKGLNPYTSVVSKPMEASQQMSG